MIANIQFIEGINELVIPEIKLTRSRDGSTGTATFIFENPNIFKKNTTKEGEIDGMYLVDKEGMLKTTDVQVKFINGRPTSLEAVYIMKSPSSWDRFIRFMEKYSKENELTFVQPFKI